LYIDGCSKYAKHYKIYKRSNKCYYLVSNKKFKSLQGLVRYYSGNLFKNYFSIINFLCKLHLLQIKLEGSYGLCCQLLNSCEKYVNIKNKPFEINENDVLIEKDFDQYGLEEITEGENKQTVFSEIRVCTYLNKTQNVM